MHQSAVAFKVKELSFEGVVAQPDNSEDRLPAVVICHPHPLYGGNMNNGVVLAVSDDLVEHGFATLRFNFRGVGSSEGVHSKGELEHEEVLAALDLMKAWPKVDGRRIGLAGYSFGTRVILGSAALPKKVKAIALISPSQGWLERSPLKRDKTPKLLITGSRDRLVESDRLQDILASFKHPPIYEVVPGADHFWAGQEKELSTHVSQFFVEHLE